VVLNVAAAALPALEDELRKLLLDRPGSAPQRLTVRTYLSSAAAASPPAALPRVLGRFLLLYDSIPTLASRVIV
jgi:hypothetical protein